MKLKLRLDKATVQEFLIQNVEKIVFGIVALVFLFLVYSAIMGVPRSQDTPDKLRQAAQSGENAISSAPIETGLEVKDYEAQAKRSRVPIKETPYTTAAILDPPVFPKRLLRDTPPLYAAQKLQGAAGTGAFSMVAEIEKPPAEDAAGGAEEPAPPVAQSSGIRGQRWIVLTALVPFDKQVEAFNGLKTSGPPNSYNPQHDVPKYLGYNVQRLEVASPADAVKPDWNKAETTTIISKEAIEKAVKQWGGVLGTDMVAQEYLLQPNLVFPLGPLAGPWNESVAHSPEIPLLGAGVPVIPVMQGPPPTTKKPVKPGGPHAAADPWGPEAQPAVPVVSNAIGASRLGYLLFRFFDFNVEPGKNYVYRVQLVLENPNYKLSTAWLQDPKLAEAYSLTTKWSDDKVPTVVSVPRDSRILAGSVKAGRDASETSAKIMIVQWMQRKGIEAFQEFPLDVRHEFPDLWRDFSDLRHEFPDVRRGQVLDFRDVPFKPGTARSNAVPVMGPMVPRRPMGPMPTGPMATGPMATGPMPTGPMGPPRNFPPTPMPMPGGPSNAVMVNYITHAIALDFRGGEPLHGLKGSNSLKLTGAGDILVLDSDGNLVVRNELDDEPECARLNNTRPERSAPGKAGGFGEPAGLPAPHKGGLETLEGSAPKKGAKKPTPKAGH